MATKTVSITAAQRNGFTIETTARNHTLFVDQPEASGGSNAGPTTGRRAALSALGARARHRLPCDPRNACAVGNGNGIDGWQ